MRYYSHFKENTKKMSNDSESIISEITKFTDGRLWEIYYKNILLCDERPDKNFREITRDFITTHPEREYDLNIHPNKEWLNFNHEFSYSESLRTLIGSFYFGRLFQYILSYADADIESILSLSADDLITLSLSTKISSRPEGMRIDYDPDVRPNTSNMPHYELLICDHCGINSYIAPSTVLCLRDNSVQRLELSVICNVCHDFPSVDDCEYYLFHQNLPPAIITELL